MGLRENILGFLSAPLVGERNDGNGYTGYNYSGADDMTEDRTFRFTSATPLPMVPLQRIDDPGDYISNRAYGVHNLIPGRALSAQTRLKNMYYEYPADKWTHNPEGPAYIVRVPGLPQQQLNLATLNSFTTQPEFLQPLVNLQIQNDMTWIQQLEQKIFGNANTVQQDQVNMFPSIYDPNWNTPE